MAIGPVGIPAADAPAQLPQVPRNAALRAASRGRLCHGDRSCRHCSCGRTCYPAVCAPPCRVASGVKEPVLSGAWCPTFSWCKISSCLCDFPVPFPQAFLHLGFSFGSSCNGLQVLYASSIQPPRERTSTSLASQSHGQIRFEAGIYLRGTERGTCRHPGASRAGCNGEY